ncbi:MAG: GNAT family N-acetyltransferase [bacterium]|nr:GNAT family N-acetyltransferase [bacterium]
MNHLGTKTLYTGRLVLRKFRDQDAVVMYRNWANDPEVTKYLMWSPHEYMEETKAYVASLIDSYQQPDTYQWAIELKEIGEVIGAIGAAKCNTDIGSVHVGYCIGRDWWNQGITSEALARVIQFFMEEVEVNRVESRHDPRNENSGKVMQKCAMQYEGTLRKSDWNNQGICDACWYSILKEEYFDLGEQ